MRIIGLILISAGIILAIVDSFVWHKHFYTEQCTVVFKPEPTVSRGGYPYYYVEVRRNDNNEWSMECVTGELHATLSKGDQMTCEFQNCVFFVLHLLVWILGPIAFMVLYSKKPTPKPGTN